MSVTGVRNQDSGRFWNRGVLATDSVFLIPDA